MLVVFRGDGDDFVPNRVSALEQAFAQIVCRCGLMYQFEPEDDCWRMVFTDVELPDRSPDPMISTYKKAADAKRDLMMQAVDGRLRNLIAVPLDQFERYRRTADNHVPRRSAARPPTANTLSATQSHPNRSPIRV